MSANVVTAEDLQNFKQELLQDLQTLFKAQPESKQWLKSEDVRKMLGISPGTLQTLRINRTLPFTKIGGTIYYELRDVEAALNANKVSK